LLTFSCVAPARCKPAAGSLRRPEQRNAHGARDRNDELPRTARGDIAVPHESLAHFEPASTSSAEQAARTALSADPLARAARRVELGLGVSPRQQTRTILTGLLARRKYHTRFELGLHRLWARWHVARASFVRRCQIRAKNRNAGLAQGFGGVNKYTRRRVSVCELWIPNKEKMCNQRAEYCV
jgi:hypothetical protein